MSKKVLSSSPFNNFVGCEEFDLDHGCAKMKVRVEPHLLRSHGLMHGGALATILDSCLGMASAKLVPEGYISLTVQLNINFTRPAKEGQLVTVQADIVHQGSKTAVSQGAIYNEEDRLIATGSATLMFVPAPKEADHKKT